MSGRTTWKARLAPFATAYEDLHRQMVEAVRAMSDEELAATKKALTRPTQTNCSWSAYRVAPLLEDVVAREQYARRVARKAATATRTKG